MPDHVPYRVLIAGGGPGALSRSPSCGRGSSPPSHRRSTGFRTESGETLPYDALLVAIGAVAHPPYERALAFGGAGSQERASRRTQLPT
jgi:hypothetical protein